MNWNEVIIFGEMCLYFICNYLAVCGYSEVRCLIIIYFAFLFPSYSIYISLFIFVFLFRLFSMLCILCFCVLFFLLYIYFCFFPISLQIYRPLPPNVNPIALDKYHITSYTSTREHPLYFQGCAFITNCYTQNRAKGQIFCNVCTYVCIYVYT